MRTNIPPNYVDSPPSTPPIADTVESRRIFFLLCFFSQHTRKTFTRYTHITGAHYQTYYIIHDNIIILQSRTTSCARATAVRSHFCHKRKTRHRRRIIRFREHSRSSSIVPATVGTTAEVGDVFADILWRENTVLG
jgi:hypothetical protein